VTTLSGIRLIISSLSLGARWRAWWFVGFDAIAASLARCWRAASLWRAPSLNDLRAVVPTILIRPMVVATHVELPPDPWARPFETPGPKVEAVRMTGKQGIS
jgi:hypothetical protein